MMRQNLRRELPDQLSFACPLLPPRQRHEVCRVNLAILAELTEGSFTHYGEDVMARPSSIGFDARSDVSPWNLRRLTVAAASRFDQVMRFGSLVVLIAAFSLMCNQPSFGQIIRFAQISDAHVYEYKNKDTDSKPENERGLRWVIDEINRRNESGPKYDFVVFTGDLNLEVILKSVPTLNRLSEKHGRRYDRLYSELEEAFRPDQSAQLNQEIDNP
jgi:hypothetical protein